MGDRRTSQRILGAGLGVARRPRTVLLAAALLISAIFAGCQIDGARAGRSAPAPNPRAEPAAAAASPQPVDADPAPLAAPSAPLIPGRTVPTLDREPLIGVLLATGPSVSLTLLQPGTIEANGQRFSLPAGDVVFTAASAGLKSNLTGKANLGMDVAIRVRASAGRDARFTALLDPPFGKPTRLTFAGSPEIHLDRASRKALLVERVGMETYLAGVMASEVNPAWPLESLKAQAVVARSYAADRYLQNLANSWQLHWHYTVDMAYGGLKPVPARTATALEQTRGQIITYHGLPVPALFHACSGGRTESAQHFRADLKGADGVTDMTVVMPSVDDPAAIPGAEALGMSATHLDWHGELPLAKVSAGLQQWAKDHPLDRLSFGTVETVRMHSRYPDSGRLATVVVRHIDGHHETDTEMSAADFRLAVGPAVIRSTAWTSCQAHGGTLVIEGHGFGHGVGLSQVSAYQMARTGSGADDILALFYPGAKLVKSW